MLDYKTGSSLDYHVMVSGSLFKRIQFCVTVRTENQIPAEVNSCSPAGTWTTRTGMADFRITFWVVEPSKVSMMEECAWAPMTITSAPMVTDCLTISSAGEELSATRIFSTRRLQLFSSPNREQKLLRCCLILTRASFSSCSTTS